jgi:sodium-independent sulfate anion transporter 11
MSTIVGNIVMKVQDTKPDIPPEQIAGALAVIAGAVLLFIGLIRAGWIVEFISLTAITSFMTGAALSIGVGQVPTMMGIPNVNNRDPTYLVIINTLKGLPNTRLDAAIGLSALTMLYGIRIFCNVMSNKQPHRKKMWFFISTLRMAFVILLYILISYLANRGIKDAKKAKFKILGPVPRGKYFVTVPLQCF